ncbi:MAG: hypothetical protein ACRC68_18595, partial [Clostridium sp.]
MKKIKQIIGVALIATLSVTLFAGCSKGEKALKGKYVESDFNLPENLEYVNNIQILESGEIVVT